MTDEQIKHMTERFLSWSLPEDFNPDNGISAVRPNYAPNVKWEPSGTNLLDYTQAEAMVRHMLEGLPDRITPEWCANMADLEVGHEVGVGYELGDGSPE